MDAAADYAAARAALTRPLPAYVSYTVNSHVKMDAIVKNASQQIVVRTRDGKILKGDPGGVPGNFAANTGNEPVHDPGFKATCYAPTGIAAQKFDGQEVEAIALHGLCVKNQGDKDFDTLYVDPRTHEPLAAVGTSNDEHVAVRIEQRFARTADYVLPSSLHVRVQGSGLMFWLDVLVDEQYADYRFSATPPPDVSASP